MHAPGLTLGRLRREARTLSLREVVREVLSAYERNDLLTSASAIAFQVCFALIPLALFGFGLLGFLGLDDVWVKHVAPDVRASTSPAAFRVIDSTVRRVLGSREVFWVTIGLAIAVWEMSGAARGVMGVFDRIYASRRSRSFKERYVVSIRLAVVTGALFLAAVAVFVAGPLVSPVLTFLRWPVCAALLFTVVAAYVRMAPSDPQPADWVSFGSLLAVAAWLATSAVFGFYVHDIADYGNVFGALATVIVTFEYFYLAAIAFLTGAQIDALVRERAAR